MKAWLTTAALLLGLGQLLTAARIYGKLHFPPEGRLYPLLHRWSGRAAILLTLPAAYHCIFKLGFGTYDARVFMLDVGTGARLNGGAAEAHAWLTFVPDWWPGRRRAAGGAYYDALRRG